MDQINGGLGPPVTKARYTAMRRSELAYVRHRAQAVAHDRRAAIACAVACASLIACVVWSGMAIIGAVVALALAAWWAGEAALHNDAADDEVKRIIATATLTVTMDPDA